MYEAIYPEDLRKKAPIDIYNKKCLPLLDGEEQLHSRGHFEELEKMLK